MTLFCLYPIGCVSDFGICSEKKRILESPGNNAILDNTEIFMKGELDDIMLCVKMIQMSIFILVLQDIPSADCEQCFIWGNVLCQKQKEQMCLGQISGGCSRLLHMRLKVKQKCIHNGAGLLITKVSHYK